MLELDPDPDVAFAEMSGVIFYLAAFGYIDGEIDAREVAFIRDTIHKVVTHRVGEGAARLAAEEARFQALVDTIQAEVVQLLNDSVVETESRHFFIRCRLKQRCFEIFKVFTPDQQRELLATIDELVLADGQAHPAELKLREELSELLRVEGSRPPPRPSPTPFPTAIARAVEVRDQSVCPVRGEASPAFALFEHSWVADDRVRRRQTAADRQLVRQALGVLAKQRKRGRAVKLKGRTSVDQLAATPSFFDGFVQGLVPQPGREYEVTVLGDLHGCYSCLKAALTQSRFLEKVAAWRKEPAKHPEPHLVMLGDYIDRGRFGFNGVLRLALRLLTAAPDNVVMLRGNHELLFEQEGVVRSLITPADSLEAIRPLVPPALLRDYRRLFDELPTALLLGRMLLTHGGIPQDGVVKALWRDLSSLNDPAIRFQMLWSDPSLSDVIPRSLQDPMVRFGFGRLQCQAFLARLGCHTLLRGHGLVSMGFVRHFDDDGVLAMTLCSAGGLRNRDLPPVSDYRLVRPMAVTIRHSGGLDGASELDAWPIEYEPFNAPERNGFYTEEDNAAGP